MKIKFKFTLLILLFITSSLNAQVVVESIISLKEKYNPLFGSESSILVVDFFQQYVLTSTDTSYHTLIKIDSEKLETSGMSIGTSIFGLRSILGSSINVSRTIDIERNVEELLLDLNGFEELYNCAKSIYTFISEQQSYSDTGRNIVSYCSYKSVTMGAEYYPKSVNNPTRFYFRMGENVTFEMDKEEFEEIMKTFRQISTYWRSRGN
ncbi:MAG: hypothetical protein AB8G22_21130 [Saprospiraceae bacterium]